MEQDAHNKLGIPPPATPVRVLVQTLTHLVPGETGPSRYAFIQNRICQDFWGREFEAPTFRFASYGDSFALDNRRCFFLVDHGEADDAAAVPVLSYEWTGDELYGFSMRIILLVACIHD